ncbi:MAG: hypothetical protein JWM62_305 [Frankiales bacterium]|nr:hypothetical protein [Frankiales bacterium]
MSPEERLLERVQQWAPRFAAGTVRNWTLLSPSLREGERFGAKLNSIGISQVPSADPLSGVDHRADVAGLAYGTSQRLIIANGRTIRRTWEWAELEEVVVLQGFVGVVLRTPDGAAHAVHQVKLHYDPLKPQPYVTAAGWVALEGCFAASQDRLDAWLERLPARVLV